MWLIVGNSFVGISLLVVFALSVFTGVILAFWMKRAIPDTARISVATIGLITTGFALGVLVLPEETIILWIRIGSIVFIPLVLVFWNIVLKPVVRLRLSTPSKSSVSDSPKKKASTSKKNNYPADRDRYDDILKENAERSNRDMQEIKNLFVLRENLPHRYACFDNGKVFAVDGTKKYLIGYYDDDGIVYSDMKQQIGFISDELIQMNRLGELNDIRDNLGDEAYFSLCRATNIAWNSAEISLYPSSFGFIQEFLGGEPIGDPDRSLMKDQSTVGYAACFVCLEYYNGSNCGGKYAGFYCSLGQKFIAPY